MLSRSLTMLILNLMAISCFAAGTIDALTASLISRKQESARIKDLRSIPQIGDIERNPDGSIRGMIQADAIKYCANKAQHLPSARELAQWASTVGAAGISESAKDGYYQVNATNADGKVDSFYFSYDGYKPPAGDLGINLVWSSSVVLHDPIYAYVLDSGVGVVDSYIGDEFDHLFAFRCASGQ